MLTVYVYAYMGNNKSQATINSDKIIIFTDKSDQCDLKTYGTDFKVEKVTKLAASSNNYAFPNVDLLNKYFSLKNGNRLVVNQYGKSMYATMFSKELQLIDTFEYNFGYVHDVFLLEVSNDCQILVGRMKTKILLLNLKTKACQQILQDDPEYTMFVLNNKLYVINPQRSIISEITGSSGTVKVFFVGLSLYRPNYKGNKRLVDSNLLLAPSHISKWAGLMELRRKDGKRRLLGVSMNRKSASLIIMTEGRMWQKIHICVESNSNFIAVCYDKSSDQIVVVEKAFSHLVLMIYTEDGNDCSVCEPGLDVDHEFRYRSRVDCGNQSWGIRCLRKISGMRIKGDYLLADSGGFTVEATLSNFIVKTAKYVTVIDKFRLKVVHTFKGDFRCSVVWWESFLMENLRRLLMDHPMFVGFSGDVLGIIMSFVLL